jgi:hypothetical protein
MRRRGSVVALQLQIMLLLLLLLKTDAHCLVQ